MLKRLAFGFVWVFVIILVVTAFAKNLFEKSVAYIPPIMTTYSGVVAGGAGNVIFYLTDNGASNGNALFSSVKAVIPIINDASVNYTYGWVVSADRKTLTINAKASAGINVALLSLTLLGVPGNVANGTVVSCIVAGS